MEGMYTYDPPQEDYMSLLPFVLRNETIIKFIFSGLILRG